MLRVSGYQTLLITKIIEMFLLIALTLMLCISFADTLGRPDGELYELEFYKVDTWIVGFLCCVVAVWHLLWN